jgi:isopenicillin-N N-acyltransferase like protein
MFPRYSLKGKPYDIGFQHGSLAKEKVKNSVENYKVVFREMGGVSWEEVNEEVEQFIPSIEKFDKTILEEIQGIADGAGLDYKSILILNARSELLMTPKMLAAMGAGCTSFGVLPELTNGITYIGQNWDFPEAQKDAIIILEIEQEGKPDILMATEAGIVGKIGINSEGVGICLNAIMTDQCIPGTPLHIIMRGVLNSPSLFHAMTVIANGNIASACNFMLGQHGVTVASMEMIPNDFELIFPNNGYVLHTNHLSDRLLAKVTDFGRRINPCTFLRLNRAKELFSQVKFINLNRLKEIQSDHVGYPHSICMHVDPDAPAKICSVFAVVADLKNKELYMTPGQPCENDYVKLTFENR